MNFDVIWENLPYLLHGAFPNGPLGGAALTVVLSILSALGSALLGIVGGVALVMTQGWARRALTIAIAFFRAIPVLMLIFWAYFLAPILFGLDTPELATVVWALSCIGGAYLAHSVAAGIASLGNGPWEAGLSLGLNRWRVLHLIVLPQALRNMLPSFLNQWISLIKDTSLAYVIGVPELSFLATQVNNRALVYPAEIFLFVGLVYFLLCGMLQLVERSSDRVFARRT